MQELVNSSVSTRRITLILLGLFSALALVLAAIGIYGVISYSVAQRTHEIGIRMALGADHGGVLRMILAQGVKIAGAGVVIGLGASFGLTRLMLLRLAHRPGAGGHAGLLYPRTPCAARRSHNRAKV